MPLNLALVVLGLAVLAKGADTFVDGAARLATILRLSPVLVGAVVVGFGTGAPELLVSTTAAAHGSIDLAVGNVIGSNLANLTLVLGVGGLLVSPKVLPRVIRREAPLAVGTMALFAILVQNGLTRAEGVVLIAALVGAVILMTRSRAVEGAPLTRDLAASGAAETSDDDLFGLAFEGHEQTEVAVASTRSTAVRVGLGLLATVAGAQLLVIGAQRIAEHAGLSGGFVGLTLVAVGTSLPELVTAIQAARRGETELLAGNVLGSNIFNSTGVAGAAAIVGPGRVTDSAITVVAVLAMVSIATLTWAFLARAGRLRRPEAATLLALYAVTVLLVR